MKVINTVLPHYHYRVYTKLGKGVCDILRIPCACPVCVSQLDKYLFPSCSTSFQPRYPHVDCFYYNKVLEHCNYWIIMEFLGNKKPQMILTTFVH